MTRLDQINKMKKVQPPTIIACSLYIVFAFFESFFLEFQKK
jgi:hypothetical protein